MKIFRSIQKAMIKQIVKSDWLSEDMKNIELDKIKNLGTSFGYPNWYDNDTIFLNYYRGVCNSIYCLNFKIQLKIC